VWGPSSRLGQDAFVEQICDDLAAEHDDLDALVAPLDGAGFDRLTPAPGWSIRDQLSHLWFFDQRATMALTDPDGFEADKVILLRGGGTDASTVPGRSMSAAALLQSWRADRALLIDHARTVDPSARVPWYGPAMGARSFLTARLMETWAHGQDVADALGVQRRPTRRLRHVCHIGVGARAFSYAIRGMTAPDVAISLQLNGPDGERWTWGPDDSADRVEGDALDFCLVVTQRRHVADTGLRVLGPYAAEWIDIAQAFAGAPGEGRSPGQFTGR
jgi:uncharacterized protein (TIGR03084 family)